MIIHQITNYHEKGKDYQSSTLTKKAKNSQKEAVPRSSLRDRRHQLRDGRHRSRDF